MKRLQFVCSAIAVAVATAFLTSGTPAQVASSGASSGHPGRQPASGSASATSEGAHTADGATVYFEYGASADRRETDPLQQADQTHAKSTGDLVAKYRETNDAQERDDVRRELNQVLEEHFNVRQQIRARELQKLEEQVRRLRELHDRREQEKDQIIRDRLNQLLRDAEGLGWGPGDAARSSAAWSYSPGTYPSQPSRYSAGDDAAPRSVIPPAAVPARSRAVEP